MYYSWYNNKLLLFLTNYIWKNSYITVNQINSILWNVIVKFVIVIILVLAIAVIVKFVTTYE